MTEWAHSVRNGIVSGERTYRLAQDALCWTETGRSDGRLAYADARLMQLISYASPIGRALQCKVTSTAGDKVLLRSAHYLSLGAFEDRTDSYGPLVRELAKRIHKANPGAAFVAGSTGLWLVWLVVGLLWVGAIALLAAALFETVFDAPLLGSFAVALGVGLWRQSQPTPRAVAAEPSEATPPPPPAEVTIRVDSVPSGARLALDGEPRGTTPATLTMERSESPRSLRLEHDGYEPLVETVRPDVAQRLRLSMREISEIAPPPAPPTAPARRASRRRATPETSEPVPEEPPEPGAAERVRAFRRFD